ncbi:ATP-binding protein [Magnetospirillum molischianum]|uniref:histidine kinase n=1 Tax=Magnetospirillum molischianum DSM 120 TaxID=1150626 RepID=H8FVH3_MAGML|nr:ATP-binding protein [Magnetospirillum molischianum]CCG42361.1 Putative histidine kinase sensor histidine kinase, classical system [Magnetospirillum molischianum DSM 120]
MNDECADAYADLTRTYVLVGDELALIAIASLGRDLVADEIPIEEIAGLHEVAMLGLLESCPTAMNEESVHRASTCLAELMMSFSGAFRERTELLEREKALEQERVERDRQRRESLGQFVGGVAHEINNLLQPIQGLAELALEDHDENSEISQSLRTILDCAVQAAAIVRGILTYVRQQTPVPQPIRLGYVVERCVGFLRAVTLPGLSIEVSIANHDALVIGDDSEFTQILMNLVNNAFHAMNYSGTVGIRVDLLAASGGVEMPNGNEQAPHARLTVTDQGCGMTDDVLAHAFDPFFTTKGPGEGTGLGLAIVRGIVRSWGGEVVIDTAPGKGTSIIILLPLIAAPAASA